MAMFLHANREKQWDRSHYTVGQLGSEIYQDSSLVAATEALSRPWTPVPEYLPDTPAGSAISLLSALAASPSRSPISLSQALTPSAASPATPARVLSLEQELAPSPAMPTLGSGPRFPPGLDPPPGTPSHGSALHSVGECRPCAWFWKAAGCQNGQDCSYCHICGEGEAKLRKKTKQSTRATPKEARLERDATCRTLSFRSDSPNCSPGGQTSDHESTVGPDTENELTAGSDQEDEKELEREGRRQKAATISDSPTSSTAGSTLHGVGQCQPCAWFWKSTGCQRGRECTFCHLCPEGELKARKASKHALMRLGRATPQPSASTAGATDKCLLNLSSLV